MKRMDVEIWRGILAQWEAEHVVRCRENLEAARRSGDRARIEAAQEWLLRAEQWQSAHRERR